MKSALPVANKSGFRVIARRGRGNGMKISNALIQN